MRYLVFVILGCLAAHLGAQEEVAAPRQTKVEERFEQFAASMLKTAMVGTFMVDGDQDKSRTPERYEISKVVKQPKGDYWSFFARIKYGDHDVTLPIPVEVKWAGKTPVITVDNLTIPGMGTFDARVVISDGKYAGMWRHGKVGGLMFGHIEKQKEEKKADTSDGAASDEN